MPHPTALGGVVIWQDPPADMQLPASAVVHLTVSTGPESSVVPDVVNLNLDLARVGHCRGRLPGRRHRLGGVAEPLPAPCWPPGRGSAWCGGRATR